MSTSPQAKRVVLSFIKTGPLEGPGTSAPARFGVRGGTGGGTFDFVLGLLFIGRSVFLRTAG